MSQILSTSDLRKQNVKYVPGKSPSTIYDYTYGYSMNFYQPMLDYLDKRKIAGDLSKENRQLPHLPWSNERYCTKYDPREKIPSYTEQEIKDHSKEVIAHARKQINDFDVKKSYFSCIPISDTTRLRKNFPKQTALEKLYKKDVGKIIEDIKTLEMDTYRKYKEGERLILEESQANFPIELKRAIKGKSANQIRNILLADSNRNINKASEDAKTLRQCYPTYRIKKLGRSLSESRKADYYYDENRESDRSIGQTLESVKQDINQFTNKTNEFLSDTRYRLHVMRNFLREQDDYLMSRNEKKRENRKIISKLIRDARSSVEEEI